MREIRKRYRSMRIWGRLLLSYLQASLVPMLLMVVIIALTSTYLLTESAGELSETYCSQAANNIEGFLEDSDRIIRSVLIDSDTLSRLENAGNYSMSEEINLYLEIRRVLMRVSLLCPSDVHVMLLTAGGELFQYSPTRNAASLELLQKEEWLQQLLQSGNGLQISAAHRMTYDEMDPDGIRVTVLRKLYTPRGADLGWLLMDIHPKDLIEPKRMVSEPNSRFPVRLLVTDAQSHPLYDTLIQDGTVQWSSVIGEKINPEELGEYHHVTAQVAEGNLTVHALIPYSALLRRGRLILITSLIVMMLGIALTVVLSGSISRRITRPIVDLQEKLVRVEEGKYQPLEQIEGPYEIRQLIGTYNSMVQEIERLIHNVYQEQLRQKDAKLLALRAQINPHFLYNTLESIRMKAMVGGDAEVSEMIKILSRMFRAVLGKDSKFSTVRDEIIYAQNYVRLQNLRFDGVFSWEADVPGDLMEMKVIPLLFQPLVENSIEHGYRGKHQQLRIRLQGFRDEGGDICFRLSDDGTGMDEDRLETIRAAISRPEADDENNGESIALRNIAERIRLRYGQEYGLQIETRLGEGTTVILRVPDQKGETQGAEVQHSSGG